jgi:hypothetical protein
LFEAGFVSEWELVGSATMTDSSEIPIADVSLLDVSMLEDDERRAALQAAVDALPEGVVAHRVGDFVFTHHGIDFTDARAGLWIVVMSPDPDVNPNRGQLGTHVVGRANGTVEAIPSHRWLQALKDQNDLRATAGLPPLPDPAAVARDTPAVAPP